MKLVIATRNLHKLEEMKSLLAIPSLELFDLRTFPGSPEVEEDGCTFESNAIKKAVTAALSTGEWSLADDSGLEVDFLDGAPGVRSARYAGEPVSYQANNTKLLAEMADAGDRRARFCCVVALSNRSGVVRTVAGFCNGRIIHAPRGTGGFGYDPLFVPDGHELTFAELGEAVKNGISHRARALARATEAWHDIFTGKAADWSTDPFGSSR
ncbi:MAG: RdgB/HAM1 family non-canonical purine NTP pyrophosphatase [bacterium]